MGYEYITPSIFELYNYSFMIYFCISIRWEQFTVLAKTSCFYTLTKYLYANRQMKKSEDLTAVVMKSGT
jgi:hypothetical protein